jgi:hypothetical protein
MSKALPCPSQGRRNDFNFRFKDLLVDQQAVASLDADGLGDGQCGHATCENGEGHKAQKYAAQKFGIRSYSC